MTYTITHTGRILSNNDAISKHWRSNQTVKNAIKKAFKYQIQAKGMPMIDKYHLVCHSHTRHDIDNLSMTVKLFNDCLKKCGVIKDDNPKIFKKLTIERVDELKKGTITFTIIPI